MASAVLPVPDPGAVFVVVDVDVDQSPAIWQIGTKTRWVSFVLCIDPSFCWVSICLVFSKQASALAFWRVLPIRQRAMRLLRTGWAHQQQRPSGQPLGMNQIRNDTQRLSCRNLADETRCVYSHGSASLRVFRHRHDGVSVLVQSQTRDVGVGGYSAARGRRRVGRGSNRFYLDHTTNNNGSL